MKYLLWMISAFFVLVQCVNIFILFRDYPDFSSLSDLHQSRFIYITVCCVLWAAISLAWASGFRWFLYVLLFVAVSQVLMEQLFLLSRRPSVLEILIIVVMVIISVAKPKMYFTPWVKLQNA